MAENLLRLKVDSQEYDAKIKRAAEGIQHFVRNIRETGSNMKESGILARSFLQELGNMSTVATGTKQQLREMSNALTTLTQTYRELSDEEKQSGFGQELNKQIQILTERAGKAQDAMADVAASIRNAASDTRVFDQLSQGASVMTAGFQGLIGAGKMLGIEMGNDVEVIAKLQAAMAVTNSLTTIQTALQKQSALMQGVQAVQAAAAAAAQTSLAGATGAATVAQAAFNAVAKANPYVLLGTAIAAVGTALWAFASASSEAKKKEEELAKAEEDATKKAQEQRDAFVNASASAMNTASRISSLQVAYKQANTEMEKTSILKQAQSEFKKLGIECKGVHDAQTLLIRDGAKIIEMIQLQGNAAALAAIRMEKFKESFKMLMENGYSASAAASLASYNKDVIELDGQINKIQGRIQSIKGTLPTSGNGPKGNKTTKQEDTNYAADSIMAQEKEVQRLTDAWNRASGAMRDGILKDLEEAKQKLEEMKKIPTVELGEVVVTGNKMKSVDKKFSEAPINFDSINTYISGVKDALKNANLGDFMYNKLTEKLKDATTVSTLLQNLMDLGVEGTDLTDAAEKLKGALLSGDIPDDKVKEYIDKLNEKIEEQGGIKLSYDPKTGKVDKDKKEESESEKEYKKFESKANQFIGGLSNVSSGLKGLGIEIPEEVDQLIGVMQSLMQIIQGVHAIIQVFSSSALAANTIAVNANTIAQYASAVVPFANGGIVPTFANGGLIGKASNGLMIPGNSFSGDNLRMPVDGGRGFIGVNSGELILNKSQQNNLASQLEGNGMQGYVLETRVNGRDLVIVMNNDGTARGRGELVRTNRRG